MSVPHSVLAYGWIPFCVTLLLVILFSCIYVRLYQSRHEKEVVSTLTSVLGLSVALLTCALVPVDIFLVSYMKESDGTFKPWAQNNHTREKVENSVLYTYYALYSLVVLFLFFFLPLAYFYYEEGDEEGTPVRSKCCAAAKYTLVFLFMALILILIGALVPFRGAPVDIKPNSTSWDDYFKNIINELQGSQRWENCLSFVISTLTVFGMITLTFYTGYGMSAWPMDLVKGRRSTTREREDIEQDQAQIQAKIEAIRNKYVGTDRRMTARERRKVEDLEDKLEVLSRRQRHLQAAENGCYRKCSVLFRPFQIMFGMIFFLLAILVFISIILTNVDKIINSDGVKSGYLLAERRFPNPIDITLVFAQKAFPLDYIIMGAIIMYFFFCSMAALKHTGIWLFCIRMYKIRPRRTPPQGLLLMCYLLMLIVLALNVMVFQLAPQYAMFGSQKYINPHTRELVQCSTKTEPDQCVMTRLSMLTTRFCYKFWFFGALYFWISWGFLLVIVLGFIISVILKRRSSIEGEVDADDITDSDEELLVP